MEQHPVFTLSPVQESEIPKLVEIYFSAFNQHPLSLACWSRNNATVRAWWETMLLEEFRDSENHLLTVKHVSTGGIAGFCKWVEPKSDGEEPPDSSRPSFPEGADAELAQRVFGGWNAKKKELMGGKRFWYLELIATLPKFQGQGAGRIMMNWGTQKADQDGVEAFLEASPDAVRLYEKSGFREVAHMDVWIENERVKPGVQYRQLFMLRPKPRASTPAPASTT